MHYAKKIFPLIVVLTIILAIFTLESCHDSPKTVKIGLVISQSGPNNTEGDRIREAAQLAADELNAHGAGPGQSFQLIVKEIGLTEESALKADKELIDEGAIAIIGHTTSKNSLVAEPYTTANKTVLFSPYAGTTKLSGKNDLFFRTAIDNDIYSKALASLLNRWEVTSVALLIDNTNDDFALEYPNLTLKHYSGIINNVRLNPSVKIKWQEITNSLLHPKPQAVILLTGTEITGLACQNLKEANFQGEIITTVWSQTPELLEYGVNSVDGITILTFVNPENKRPAFRQFANSLRQRYNTYPRAKSVRAYEAVYIIAEALKRCPPEPTTADLKKALLAEPFETLLGPIHFDTFGDVIRPLYILRINNGRFHNAGEISLN